MLISEPDHLTVAGSEPFSNLIDYGVTDKSGNVTRRDRLAARWPWPNTASRSNWIRTISKRVGGRREDRPGKARADTQSIQPRLTGLLEPVISNSTRGVHTSHSSPTKYHLLEAGANISAKEEVYRSTQLGFAARNNMPDMVDILLSRGAPSNLPDDEPWSTPLAWSERRGHVEISQILRNHGAIR